MNRKDAFKELLIDEELKKIIDGMPLDILEKVFSRYELELQKAGKPTNDNDALLALKSLYIAIKNSTMYQDALFDIISLYDLQLSGMLSDFVYNPDHTVKEINTLPYSMKKEYALSLLEMFFEYLQRFNLNYHNKKVDEKKLPYIISMVDKCDTIMADLTRDIKMVMPAWAYNVLGETKNNLREIEKAKEVQEEKVVKPYQTADDSLTEEEVKILQEANKKENENAPKEEDTSEYHYTPMTDEEIKASQEKLAAVPEAKIVNVRDRLTYETDEEYVNYLKEEYAKVFPPKVEYNYTPMTDEEIKASQAKLAEVPEAKIVTVRERLPHETDEEYVEYLKSVYAAKDEVKEEAPEVITPKEETPSVSQEAPVTSDAPNTENNQVHNPSAEDMKALYEEYYHRQELINEIIALIDEPLSQDVINIIRSGLEYMPTDRLELECSYMLDKSASR